MLQNFVFILSGGIDFDSTPRTLVFPAGETSSCIDVEIFPDPISEDEEQFTVIVTTNSSDGVLPPPGGRGPVITITDEGKRQMNYNPLLESLSLRLYPVDSSVCPQTALYPDLHKDMEAILLYG